MHDWTGSRSSIKTSRRLFGSPYSALCHDFPAHLNHLVDVAFDGEEEARVLALRHTLLGYFLVAAPERLVRRTLSAVGTSAMPGIKMNLGITASRVGGHHPLKACSICVAEDVEEHGTASWRMVHQLPSVLVCQQHAQPLFIAWDPITPVHRRHWLTPTVSANWTRVSIPVLSDEHLHRVLQLATYSAAWARCEPGSFDPSCLAECYRARLRARGLATASGRLRLRPLIAEARQYYRCLPDGTGHEALRGFVADWSESFATLSRRRPRSGHPFKHLLAITLLFDSWDDFVHEYGSLPNEPESPASEVVVADDRSCVTRLRSLITERGMSVSAAAREMGIATNTALCIAQREDIPLSRRPKKLRRPLLATVRKLLAHGRPLPSISRQTGLARVTLNRILRGDVALANARRAKLFAAQRDKSRAAFLSARRKHPDANLKQIRAKPGNGYSWLFRHDRFWLLEYSRPQGVQR